MSSMCGGFDPRGLRRWLAERVDWGRAVELCDVRLTRLWPGRAGRLALELALTLRVGAEENEYRLQGIRGTTGLQRCERRHARICNDRLAGLRVCNEGSGVWCATPDKDPKLRTVRDLLSPRRAVRVLGPKILELLLASGGNDAHLRCELASYRLTKRCALIVSASGAPRKVRLFVKVFGRATVGEHAERIRDLGVYLENCSGGRARIPRLVYSSPTDRLVLMEALDPRARTLTSSTEDVVSATSALAILHRWPGDAALRPHSPHAELETVRRWVPALRWLGDDGHHRLQALVNELARMAAHVPERDGKVVHRDFFHSQLSQCGDTLWVLDLDTLAIGHPELDLATFIAHLLLEGALAGTAAGDLDALSRIIVATYNASGLRAAPERLQFYVPCALARLGAIHSARGVPATARNRLWEQASTVLGGSSGVW